MKYKAILWDCDGVLVDSEYIACGAAVEFLAQHGYRTTLEDFLTRFMGKGRQQILEDVRAESGLDLSAVFMGDTYGRFQNERFTASLKAVSGVESVLNRAEVPMAVASGSELARLHFTLGLADLLHHFDGHIYSAEGVAKGKPAPDIFLHAAEKLGVAPEECLVIEDGIHGIHAAQAAGMEVWAYLGGGHIFPALRTEILATKPNRVFDSMADIYTALFSEENEIIAA